VTRWTRDTALGEAALAARRRGWSVVPMHSVVDGRCTCGAPQCPSPGKHPRVRWDEYQSRRPGEDEVRHWWQRWPGANLGVVTGAVSGLVVVDLDPRAGGDEELARLEARHGTLPDTVECLTGGGGLHLYFRHPGVSVPSRPFVPGIDVKGDGGLVVAPPSLHRSGARYVWEPGCSPDEHDLAEVPGWIADPEPAASSHAASRVFAPRTTGERREFADLWEALGVRITSGDRYYLCPLHDDRHPSLHIDAEGCRWYCFGCQRGGGPGRLRRIVARRGSRGERPIAAPARREPAPHETAPRAPVVPSTWLQWPALQPGGAQSVVGEANYADALEHLAGGRGWAGPRLRWFTACLRREHTNPHDPGAVRVDIGSATVGYLPRDDARRFHGVLDELARMHEPATARARLTGGWERGPYGRGSIGVSLDVDPSVVRRRPDAPFLPAEIDVAVRTNPARSSALDAALGDRDSLDCTASLLPPPEGGTPVLQVHIDGDGVGMLTEATTRRYLALVERVLAAGFPATCAATIVRRRHRPAIVVRLPRPDGPE
jgi:hypothetical protein